MLNERHLKLAVGTVAGALIGMTLEAKRLERKHNKLVERHNRLLEKYKDAIKHWGALNEQMSYMISVLNEHQVPLTEFDLIALPTVLQFKKEGS